MKNLYFSFFLDIFAKKGKPETFNYFLGGELVNPLFLLCLTNIKI